MNREEAIKIAKDFVGDFDDAGLDPTPRYVCLQEIPSCLIGAWSKRPLSEHSHKKWQVSFDCLPHDYVQSPDGVCVLVDPERGFAEYAELL